MYADGVRQLVQTICIAATVCQSRLEPACRTSLQMDLCDVFVCQRGRCEPVMSCPHHGRLVAGPDQPLA